MPRLINWELARNPINWISVFAMLSLVGFAITLITSEGDQ